MNRTGGDDPFIPDLADPGWDPQPVCWPVIDGEAAYVAWSGLDTWVRWCARRYALDQRTIPPCWWRHGALVEELTALVQEMTQLAARVSSERTEQNATRECGDEDAAAQCARDRQEQRESGRHGGASQPPIS